MDNEKYEATIDLNILPFEQKIKRVTKLYDSFIAEAKKSKWINDKFFYIDKTKDQTAQIEEMWAKMREFASGSEGALGGNALVNTAIPEIMEETASLMDTLGQNTEEMAQATNELNVSVEHTKKTFVGFTPSIKRMGLALLGVRSGFALFRKAVNSVIAQNEELGAKFDAIWRGIGNALAPILERIVNLILKAFTYLNLFVKAVSGGKLDLFANTSASAKSTAGSLKEANKYLAGFDELNNVDEQNSSGGGGSGGITDPFKDIDVNTKWADAITQFGEWVKINWPLVLGLLAGTWLALQPCYDAFSSWEKLGIVLVIAGIAEGFKGMYDFINGIKTKNLDLITQGLNEIAIAIGLVSVGFLLLTQGATGGLGIIIAAIVAFTSFVIKNWDTICADLKALWNNLKQSWDAIWNAIKELAVMIGTAIRDKIVEVCTNIRDKWTSLKQTLSEGMTSIKNWFVEKWENIKTKFTDVKNKMVEGWDAFKEKVRSGAEKISGFFTGISDGVKTMANNVIGTVEGMINKAVNGINSLIRSINKISFNTPDWIPVIGGKTFGFNIGQLNSVVLPRLDTGTNYVPSDQLAMIHKGEAVVPKKFNSGEFFGGNDELVDKLDVLIDVVNNLDINPYITVKDVGEASVKYQNQQYRLRGRSLVNG